MMEGCAVKHVVKGFEHVPGVHCGSTALADVLRFYGLPLDEAACFGLGSGLDFIYVESDQLSPTRFFNGRTPSLEPTLFQHLGLDVDWNRSETFPWSAIRQYVARDIPVFVLTDLYYLDYYKTKTHFSLHGVLVVGFDDERGVCLTADTDREGIQETSIESLRLAMSSTEGAVPLSYPWFAVEALPEVDLSRAARRAIARTASRMVSPPDASTGIPAMERFVEGLPDWGELADWKWAARFGYQVIERRGTGGGAFRAMYARFLSEAQSRFGVEELRELQASWRMERIAGGWRELGKEFRRISEGQQPKFAAAAVLVRELLEQERQFFQDLYCRFVPEP